jgi:phosphoglycerol geranylgeranyltransferase
VSESISIYNRIKTGNNLIGILIDPEKFIHQHAQEDFAKQLNSTVSDFILVGGSSCTSDEMEFTIGIIKQYCRLPIVLFPGSSTQVSKRADGILFLSLLSGRNPDFLIGHHVAASQKLIDSNLEIIPTAYLLLDGGRLSSVQKYSGTFPLSQSNPEIIYNTALAGKLLGLQLTYLDAGSGAIKRISSKVIEHVKATGIPLIVGGGIRTVNAIKEAHAAGANMVVIGSKLEENPSFLEELKNYRQIL